MWFAPRIDVVKPSRAVGSGSGVADDAGVADGAALAEGAALADAAGEPEASGLPDAAAVAEGSADGSGEAVRPGVGVGGRGVTDSTGPGVSWDSHAYADPPEDWKKRKPINSTPTTAAPPRIRLR